MSGAPLVDRSLERAVRDWIDADPDATTRAELEALLAARDESALHERFDHPLRFGTAGLRGPVGAGPGAMNRLVVRRTAAGVAHWVRSKAGGAAAAGIVVGRDARHGSAEFARDTVDVASAAGVAVHELARPLPTPLTAFAVRHLAASAGVVVTASHNPAHDNGYKVYDRDGSQVVPPADVEIENASRWLAAHPEAPPASRGEVRAVDEASLLAAYERSVVSVLDPHGPRDLLVAYTPLHGVGGAVVPAMLRRAGFEVVVVDAQADPDPDFPTVAFPNPEEPGALDLVVGLATQIGADLVVANDPDADRLCVAVPAGTTYRALSGDELGGLLGEERCTSTVGADRIVATSIVSSTMLSKIAAAHRVEFAETLTGFKWLGRTGTSTGRRLVFAYEEALGYAVTDAVADKDGISAALLVCSIAASRKAAGTSIQDGLDDLAATYGVHATAQRSYRREGASGIEEIAAMLERILAHPPPTIAGREVTAVEDLAAGVAGLPPTEGVRLWAGGSIRVIVRPSGTEPKLKAYVEVVAPPSGPTGLAASRDAAGALLAVGCSELDALCTAT